MAKRSIYYFKHVTRSVIILILVTGVAGLGSLNAGQLACDPDCLMHKVHAVESSCCSGAEVAQPEVDQSHGCSEGHQTTRDTCCNGTTCLDSSFNVQGITAAIGGSADIPEAGPVRLSSASSPFDDLPEKFLSVSFPPGSNTPIYIRTCVYLI